MKKLLKLIPLVIDFMEKKPSGPAIHNQGRGKVWTMVVAEIFQHAATRGLEAVVNVWPLL